VPLSMARHRRPRRQGWDQHGKCGAIVHGAALHCAAPLSMARHCTVRRHGAWRGTSECISAPRPGPGKATNHFPLHTRARQLLSLPLLILPPKSLKIEGFLWISTSPSFPRPSFLLCLIHWNLLFLVTNVQILETLEI
jgi:hypothetical protein